MKQCNYSNIRYGELVELASWGADKKRDFKSGYHSGVKVHFFNKKGVFVGNVYEFVPYSSVRFRKDSPIYERHFMIKKDGTYQNKAIEFVKMKWHIFKCRIVTVLIRSTQKS